MNHLMRAPLVLALALSISMLAPSRAIAEEAAPAGEAVEATQPGPVRTGPGVGLDVSAGLIGVFASVNVGLLFPKLGERVQLGLRASWSMPAVEVAHEDIDDEVISYLPWMITGGLFVHAGSGVIRDLVRVYFGAELVAGATFATRSGLIGDNVTVGLYLWGGLEVYVNQRVVLFIEGGASGVFTIETGEAGALGGITQHGGSGFFARVGPRFYFGG